MQVGPAFQILRFEKHQEPEDVPLSRGRSEDEDHPPPEDLLTGPAAHPSTEPSAPSPPSFRPGGPKLRQFLEGQRRVGPLEVAELGPFMDLIWNVVPWEDVAPRDNVASCYSEEEVDVASVSPVVVNALELFADARSELLRRLRRAFAQALDMRRRDLDLEIPGTRIYLGPGKEREDIAQVVKKALELLASHAPELRRKVDASIGGVQLVETTLPASPHLPGVVRLRVTEAAIATSGEEFDSKALFMVLELAREVGRVELLRQAEAIGSSAERAGEGQARKSLTQALHQLVVPEVKAGSLLLQLAADIEEVSALLKVRPGASLSIVAIVESLARLPLVWTGVRLSHQALEHSIGHLAPARTILDGMGARIEELHSFMNT